MVFSRQGMPNMDTTSIEACLKGAYVVHGGEGTPDCIIIGAFQGHLALGSWEGSLLADGSQPLHPALPL
jgi:hypothetical protein